MINIMHLFTYFCGDSIENSSISENNQSCYISNNLSFQKLFAHVNLSNKYFLWINCLKCKRNVLKPTWMSGSHISDKKFVEAIKCPEGPQPVELLLIKILKKPKVFIYYSIKLLHSPCFFPKKIHVQLKCHC